MDAIQLNYALLLGQDKIRKEIDAWACLQKNYLSVADARNEFEQAVLGACQGSSEWQAHTNSNLCAALGYCTLVYRIERD